MGTSVLQLPVVQDALAFAVAKLATWQDVPSRVAADLAALQARATEAQAAGDGPTLAQLTAIKQALQGVQQQYLDSAALLGSVLRTAQAAQTTGAQPDAGQIADAGRLAAVIASGLGALQASEQALVEVGAVVQVGPGGSTLPAWAKWGGIGLGLYFFYRLLRG